MTVTPYLFPSAAAEVQAPSDDELHRLDAYWRTANHLAVGMIDLQDNPLLREPQRHEHGTDAPEINNWRWSLGHSSCNV